MQIPTRSTQRNMRLIPEQVRHSSNCPATVIPELTNRFRYWLQKSALWAVEGEALKCRGCASWASNFPLLKANFITSWFNTECQEKYIYIRTTYTLSKICVQFFYITVVLLKKSWKPKVHVTECQPRLVGFLCSREQGRFHICKRYAPQALEKDRDDSPEVAWVDNHLYSFTATLSKFIISKLIRPI